VTEARGPIAEEEVVLATLRRLERALDAALTDTPPTKETRH
jgi:hypothetical protein